MTDEPISDNSVDARILFQVLYLFFFFDLLLKSFSGKILQETKGEEFSLIHF